MPVALVSGSSGDAGRLNRGGPSPPGHIGASYLGPTGTQVTFKLT